jgi:hypothetical protein
MIFNFVHGIALQNRIIELDPRKIQQFTDLNDKYLCLRLLSFLCDMVPAPGLGEWRPRIPAAHEISSRPHSSL